MLVQLGNSLAPTLRDSFTSCAANDHNIQLLSSQLGKFVSSEAYSEIIPEGQELAGKAVTIIMSPAALAGDTANDFVMELYLNIRTLKRNGAGAVWVVMPFAPYMRQDRAFDGRMTSVAIDDLAFMLKQAGVEGVSTIEAHSQAGIDHLESHFGKGQVFNLEPTELFTAHIKAQALDNLAVGGPDAGANARADAVAKALQVPRFAFTKQHVASTRQL